MGGSSKKVTVGYKYYLGMHMILCHGPVDRILRIRVDKRDAWIGSRRSGRIYVNKPSLFGGESREGGIQGDVDFEPGEATQGQNDYLRARLGSLVPNYRGVVGVVLRQVFVGLNPYLKNWDFRISRVLTRQDGIPQWYPDTAVIPTTESFKVRQRILFAIDDSGSMNTTVGFTGSQTRMDVLKDNLQNVIDELRILRMDASVPLDIAVVRLNGGSTQYIDASDANLVSLKAYVAGMTASGGTDFTPAFNFARSYFSPHSGERRNVMVLITDGVPTAGSFPDALAAAAPILNRQGAYSGNNEVDVHAVNIDLDNTDYSQQLDNTGGDGVPVVDGSSSSALYNAVFFAFMGDAPAMNIVHAVRECLTDPTWGMGYAESDIDDESFRKAADRLRQERLGICIQWDRQKPIQDMITEFLRHADAALYVDRKTGLFTIKLIRDDYNKEDLLHLTEANIQKVDNFSRPAFGELTTSITVNYWNVSTGENASVTAQDIALAAMQQATVETTLQYPGLPDPVMASKVANRALRLMSSQLAKCTVYADRSAKDVTIGDAIRITWPEYGLEDTVFRVTEVAYGNGRSNRIKLGLIEDAFGAPVMNYITPAEPEWEDPSGPPNPVTQRVAFEAPYLEMVQRLGQTYVNAVLNDNPDAGYVGVAAVHPGGSAINARAYLNSGSGFEDVGLVDFSPGGKLAHPVGWFDETFGLVDVVALDEVTLGSWGQVGEELFTVLAIEGNTVTVRRAILDTVPQAHPAGSSVIFWDEFSTVDDTEYITSDVVETKIAAVSGGGETELGAIAPVTVVVQGRAARPYRPAGLRMNGQLETNNEDYPNWPVELTWAHRNNQQETGGMPLAWTDPSVVPPEGLTYTLIVEALEADLSLTAVAYEQSGINGEQVIVTPENLGVYAVKPYVRVKVYAELDGIRSWRPASLVFRGPFQAPNSLTAVYRPGQAPTSVGAFGTKGIEPLRVAAGIEEL